MEKEEEENAIRLELLLSSNWQIRYQDQGSERHTASDPYYFNSTDSSRLPSPTFRGFASCVVRVSIFPAQMAHLESPIVLRPFPLLLYDVFRYLATTNPTDRRPLNEKRFSIQPQFRRRPFLFLLLLLLCS